MIFDGLWYDGLIIEFHGILFSDTHVVKMGGNQQY